MISEYYNNLYNTKNIIRIIDTDPIIMRVNNFLSEEECNNLIKIINENNKNELNILDNNDLFDLFKKITLLLKIPGIKIEQSFKKKIINHEKKNKINILLFLENSNNEINISYNSKEKTIKEEYGKLLIIDSMIKLNDNENNTNSNKLFISYTI